MKEFLLFQCIISLATTQIDPNCMVLKASNYFGSSIWYTNPSSCFTHSMDNVNNLTIHYTNQSISRIAFDFDDGTNKSYIELDSPLNSNKSINLRNSYIIGVDVWIGSAINGLQFKLKDNINTSLMGSSDGCKSFLNSTYMNSKYFKIDSISGCIDDKNSSDFPSIGFHFSFSQCPFNISTSSFGTSALTMEKTTLATLTSSSTTETTTFSIESVT